LAGRRLTEHSTTVFSSADARFLNLNLRFYIIFWNIVGVGALDLDGERGARKRSSMNFENLEIEKRYLDL